MKEIFGLNKFYIVALVSVLRQLPRMTNSLHNSLAQRVQNPGVFLSVWHVAPHRASDAAKGNTALFHMQGYETILELCQNLSAFRILKMILVFNARRTTKCTAIFLHTSKMYCSCLRPCGGRTVKERAFHTSKCSLLFYCLCGYSKYLKLFTWLGDSFFLKIVYIYIYVCNT